jgi:hypothetical protein
MMVQSIVALDETRLSAMTPNNQWEESAEDKEKEDVVMKDVVYEPKDYWFTSSMIDAFLETSESQKEGSLY